MPLLIAQKYHVLIWAPWEQHWATKEPKGTVKRREGDKEGERVPGEKKEAETRSKVWGGRMEMERAWRACLERTTAGAEGR